MALEGFAQDDFDGFAGQEKGATIAVAEFAVKVLGAFIGQGGGKDLVEALGLHGVFPVENQLPADAFAALGFAYKKQVHEGDVVPKVSKAQQAEQFRACLGDEYFAAGDFFGQHGGADVMVEAEQGVEILFGGEVDVHG